MSGSIERAGGVAFAPLAAAWPLVKRHPRAGAAALRVGDADPGVAA